MRKSVKISLTILLTAALLLSSFIWQPKPQAITPQYSTIKVGLFFGSTALPSANLQNVSGYGSGFQFGIFDANRQFVPLGASTAETKITMLRDRNMVYDSSNNCYNAGTVGSVIVGCFHIQMDTAYATYAEAAAAAALLPNSFVKYSSGSFYACSGNYISYEEANAAITANGLSGCSVTSGTSSTVTVVKSGTNTILFEFEYGSSYYLVVMPVSADGTKCQTWFKNYRYYGGFQYPRYDGADLTVYNCVDIEDYVKGVIPYEMSPTWPLEALKAQAVCARTYVVTSKKHTGFDVCTTEDCQVYRGVGLSNATTNAAVEQTAGQYLTYNGTPIIAYYASSDGGATENSENVWKEALPYLRGKIDPYEADIVSIAPGYKWTVTYTADEITTRLRNKGYSCGTIVNIAVTQTTEVGNVYKVTLTDANGVKWNFTKLESIRSALGVSSIRFTISGSTSNASIYVNPSGSAISGGLQSSYAVGGSGLSELLGTNTVYALTGTGETAAVGVGTQTGTSSVFTITGTGRGHNIGMSQWGAYSMAKYHNMTFDQILKFYYTGVSIG